MPITSFSRAITLVNDVGSSALAPRPARNARPASSLISGRPGSYEYCHARPPVVGWSAARSSSIWASSSSGCDAPLREARQRYAGPTTPTVRPSMSVKRPIVMPTPGTSSGPIMRRPPSCSALASAASASGTST